MVKSYRFFPFFARSSVPTGADGECLLCCCGHAAGAFKLARRCCGIAAGVLIRTHSCPAIYGAGPQLPGHLWGRPTVARPFVGQTHTQLPSQLPGAIGKRSLSPPVATPHIRPESMAAESYVGMPSRATELLRESPSHPAEDCSEAPPATDIFATFKGWAVGRYSVVLTRGEVLDALSEEWQVVGGKICDAELHYLVWKMPASRRRRRRVE